MPATVVPRPARRIHGEERARAMRAARMSMVDRRVVNRRAYSQAAPLTFGLSAVPTDVTLPDLACREDQFVCMCLLHAE